MPMPDRRPDPASPAPRAMRIGVAALLGASALALLAGCASARTEAAWRDPQFAGTSLRGRVVLVACEAAEDVVQKLCVQQMTAQVVAYGATPVEGPTLATPIAPRETMVAPYLPAARQAGAAAVLVTMMAPDASATTASGLSIGLGIGGFGFGGGRGGVGGGVGVSAPVGAPTVHTGYAANGALSDVATGKLMWSAKVSAPAGDAVARQVDLLAEGLAEAASKAGLF